MNNHKLGWIKRKQHGFGIPWNKGLTFERDKSKLTGKYFNCLICKKEFYRPPSSFKRAQYCSYVCYGKARIGIENFHNINKGHIVIYNCEECIKKIEVKKANYDKAKHHFCSVKCASIYQGRLKSKENHWNWKGGITTENHLLRDSLRYKHWRIQIFQRDKFACVMCGYRSHKKRDIRADHIKPFSLYPKLRFDISNGRTLCLPCDLKNGWNLFRENNPKIQVA